MSVTGVTGAADAECVKAEVEASVRVSFLSLLDGMEAAGVAAKADVLKLKTGEVFLVLAAVDVTGMG